jgi:hypothetical protein
LFVLVDYVLPRKAFLYKVLRVSRHLPSLRRIGQNLFDRIRQRGR